MNDIEEIDSGLSFEAVPNPVNTHDNWIKRKFDEMTIASEMRIKGETMGLDIKKQLSGQLSLMFQTALTGQVAGIGETMGDMGGPIGTALQGWETVKDLAPNLDMELIVNKPLSVLKQMWEANPKLSELWVRYLSSAACAYGTVISAIESVRAPSETPEAKGKLREIINE